MNKINNKPQNNKPKHRFSLQCVIKSPDASLFIPKRPFFTLWTKIGLAQLDYSAEVCFRIVDKNEIQTLNHLYRTKNTPTNVLSFPSERPKDIPQKSFYLGDIILCAEIIQEEALEQNKAIEAHWAHMAIHGLLHLLGYDHIQDKDAHVMETLEIQLLEQLGWTNPYEETIHV